MPAGTVLNEADNSFVLPPGSALTKTADRTVMVTLPDNTKIEPTTAAGDQFQYQFPPECVLRSEPVDRWRLAQVIALAVFGICLWGSLVGSMLPLLFRRLGIDPAMASSPFVATFVDVTGIIIYFTIAKTILADLF